MAQQKFEQLEDRVLMAGNVIVDFTAGTITGDNAPADDDNDIVVYTRLNSSGDTVLVVEGRNGTLVNGGASATSTAAEATGIATLTINMALGDDTLDINGLTGLTGLTALNVTGGAGDDVIAIADVNQDAAALTIGTTGMGGDDTISIGSRFDVSRVDSINFVDNDGSNSIYMTDITVDNGITANFTGSNTDDTNVFFAADVALAAGNASVTLANSADTVLMVNVQNAGSAVVINGTGTGGADNIAIYDAIAGAISITDGNGADNVNIYTSTVLTNIVLNVGSGGTNTPGSEQRLGVYGSIVSGGLIVNTAAPASAGSNVLATDQLTLGGASTITLGDAADVIFIRDTFGGGPLTINAGGGADRVGLNDIDFHSTTVAVQTGNGADQFSIGNGSDVGQLNLTDSEGLNGFFITDTTVRFGGLSITGAAATGNNVFMARTRVVAGATTITGGDQVDTIQLLDGTSIRGGAFTLDTGNSADVVTINKAAFRSATFSASLGGSDDTLSIADTNFEIVGGFTFNGNGGTNTATVTGTTRANKSPTVNGFTTGVPIPTL